MINQSEHKILVGAFKQAAPELTQQIRAIRKRAAKQRERFKDIGRISKEKLNRPFDR